MEQVVESLKCREDGDGIDHAISPIKGGSFDDVHGILTTLHARVTDGENGRIVRLSDPDFRSLYCAIVNATIFVMIRGENRVPFSSTHKAFRFYNN
jgi:hypothetical protein